MSQFDDMQEKEYFECACGDMDHIMRMSYFTDDVDFMYVDIHLRQKPFFMIDQVLLFDKFSVPVPKFPRPWRALKYLFGWRSGFGDFDEVLWEPKDAKRVRDMVDKFLKVVEDNKRV